MTKKKSRKKKIAKASRSDPRHFGKEMAKALRDVRRIVFSWKEPALFGDIRLEIVPVDRI